MLTFEEMIPWILLHRTHLKQYSGSSICAIYANEIYAEFELIKPFLPPTDSVKKILDIGCGLAGIDILLQKHYPDAKLYLLDSDGPAEQWGSGWNQNLKPFNDLNITGKFLRANSVYPDGLWPVDTTDPLEADLVVSFLSWGFHYSLFKYRVKTPCAIATIRSNHISADSLFFQTEYREKNVGKDFVKIADASKYRLLKFSFDNLTPVR